MKTKARGYRIIRSEDAQVLYWQAATEMWTEDSGQASIFDTIADAQIAVGLLLDRSGIAVAAVSMPSSAKPKKKKAKQPKGVPPTSASPAD